MDISNELIKSVSDYAFAHEKTSRYEHSLRVAQTSLKMCALYGLDPDRGYFSGLAHDICKDMDESLMLELCKKNGWTVSSDEEKNTSLLHGKAAAVVLKNEFGIFDEDILEAVAFHTLGDKNAGDLAKIVFAADKIEPGRPQSTEEYRAALFKKSLDGLVLSVLEENFSYLSSKGKKPAAISLEFAESLRQKIIRDNKEKGE